jgi:hypothetical protein
MLDCARQYVRIKYARSALNLLHRICLINNSHAYWENMKETIQETEKSLVHQQRFLLFPSLNFKSTLIGLKRGYFYKNDLILTHAIKWIRKFKV